MAGLVSELVDLHDGQYIVRALVQIGDLTLASGLAAEATVELAEDRAKTRALEAFGIQSFNPSLGSLPTPPAPDASTSTMPSASLPVKSTAPVAMPSVGSVASSLAENLPPLEPLEPIAKPTKSSTKTKSSSVPPAESLKGNGKPDEDDGLPDEPTLDAELPELASPSTPVDLSDVIAQTTVELKRLGWGEAQGRKYLQQTYSKRSRQQLTDDELLDFLKYLQTQPTPTEV